MEKTKCVELGDMYAAEEKSEEAYKYYLEGAIGEKDPDAMVKLANMYLNETYLRPDFEKAFHYMTMAFDSGADPIMIMSETILNIDVLRDDEFGSRKYREFLKHIYDEKNPALNIWLAQEYKNGVFGTDIEKYTEYCEKAVKAGDSIGYDLLGELYFNGEYVKQDYEKAHKYFTNNNDNSSDTKLYCLGEMYRSGLFVDKDLEKAKYYYRQLINFINRFEEIDPSESMYYDEVCEKLEMLEKEG